MDPRNLMGKILTDNILGNMYYLETTEREHFDGLLRSVMPNLSIFSLVKKPAPYSR